MTPSWTEEDFERYEARRLSRRPKPEFLIPHEPLAAAKGKTENPTRYAVRVVSLRKRLIDPDNLCPKYFIDALRYAGAIPDDSAKFIEIQTTQRKVNASDEERTEITVDSL